MKVVDGTELYNDAIKRICQLEQQCATLAAEVDRMRPLIEILGLWRIGEKRTPDGAWVEGEMVARYDNYEASKVK